MGPRAFPYSIWEYVCVLIAHSNINAFPFIVKVSSCDTIIQLMFIKSQNSQFIKSVLFIVYKSRIFDFITSQTRKHMSFFFYVLRKNCPLILGNVGKLYYHLKSLKFALFKSVAPLMTLIRHCTSEFENDWVLRLAWFPYFGFAPIWFRFIIVLLDFHRFRFFLFFCFFFRRVCFLILQIVSTFISFRFVILTDFVRFCLHSVLFQVVQYS